MPVMDLFECAIGQRVRYRENGQPATIKQLWRAQGQIEIEFDNGMRERVSPKMVEKLGETSSSPARKRPCPQCGADMGESIRCSGCGFEYRQPAAKRPAVGFWIALVVIAAAAVAAWKFWGGR